jgi:hypothetical protein
MAVAARGLAAAATDPHRKRVIARYVFVYLDDVIRFGAAWRNELAREDATRAAAESSLPALDRLRADWDHYQHVRDYIAAKRKPREPDAELDQLASFKLWADIGELSVSTLVDDAVEFYVQLAAVSRLRLVDLAPAVTDRVADALDALDPVNEEALISITASTFGADRASAFPIRMGGEIGRVVPLINDVAENVLTLREIAPLLDQGSALDRLVRCQLPSELNELLRLAVGPAPDAPPSSERSLLDLYSQPTAPSAPKKQLEGLRDAMSQSTRNEIYDWRNRLGAHIDASTPWSGLRAEIDSMDLESNGILGLADTVVLWLDVCACSPAGPLPLLFPARQAKSVIDRNPELREALAFGDPDAERGIGSLPSALPPSGLDSPYGVWVPGPPGVPVSAVVAGMHAARSREVQARVEAAHERERRRGRRGNR